MGKLKNEFIGHVENCDYCQDHEGDNEAQSKHFWDSLEAKE